MRKLAIIALAVLCMNTAFAQKKDSKTDKNAAKTEQPKTITETTSYAWGASIAGTKEQAANMGLTIDWKFFVLGLQEALDGKNQFNDEQMQAQFNKLDSLVAEGRKIKSQVEKDFLEKNKHADGVTTTPSGLQYKVVKMGTGAKPAATNTVNVHYEGKTIDGNVFDSSIARGEPVTFPLNQVIKGWTEGLQLMPVGSEFIFYIPSELGYGEQGVGGMIPPNATLIFNVQLLNIVSE